MCLVGTGALVRGSTSVRGRGDFNRGGRFDDGRGRGGGRDGVAQPMNWRYNSAFNATNNSTIGELVVKM